MFAPLMVFNWFIFWAFVVVFLVVQGLLVHSAVRLRRSAAQSDAPSGGDTRTELAWTLVTALVSAGVLVFVFRALW